MKTLGVLLLVISAGAMADQYVQGYIKRDGTYVEPHYKTDSNAYKFDNYSSSGNTNPYTGEKGYKKDEYDSGYSQNPYNTNQRRSRSKY